MGVMLRARGGWSGGMETGICRVTGWSERGVVGGEHSRDYGINTILHSAFFHSMLYRKNMLGVKMMCKHFNGCIKISSYREKEKIAFCLKKIYEALIHGES